MTEAKDGDIALASLMKRYASEGQAWIDLGEMVWPNNHPVCTYCGTIDHAYYLKPKEGPRTTRKDSNSDRMKKAVKETRGKRLIYEETIGESRAKWLDWVIAISAT